MSDGPSPVDRVARRLPSSTRGRTLVAAGTFGGVGFGVAAAILAPFSAGGDLGGVVGAALLAVAAGLGAAIAAGPLWWVTVERPRTVSLLRGALVGAAVGVLAHPLMWLLVGVALAVDAAIRDGVAGLVETGPAAYALALLLFSVGGLVIAGLVTVPVAAGTGVALAHLRSRAGAARPQRARRHV